MTRPGYPAYRNTLRALGTSVVELACGAEVRYQPTVAMLEAERVARGAAPKGLVVASPANPTGTIIDADELAAIARWCDAHGVLLVSDEIYHGVTYGRECASAWRTSREAVVQQFAGQGFGAFKPALADLAESLAFARAHLGVTTP